MVTKRELESFMDNRPSLQDLRRGKRGDNSSVGQDLLKFLSAYEEDFPELAQELPSPIDSKTAVIAPSYPRPVKV